MGDIWPALLLALTHDCRMAQCRDLENHHHEKLLEIAINTLEKILKGEMDEDLPDDVRAVSKDGRTGAQQPGQGPEVARLSVTSSRRSLCLPLKETVTTTLVHPQASCLVQHHTARVPTRAGDEYWGFIIGTTPLSPPELLQQHVNDLGKGSRQG